MYISEFTVKKLNRLRPDIERIVDDTIDRMLTDGPPTDLVQAFALPVPSLVISQMLGVPYADHEFFERASNDIVTGTSPEVTANAFAELTEYLAKLAANPPHEGVIARLASTGELSTAEIATDALILLAAGHDTTASTIALGVITLLAHPEQLAAMRAGQNVVEELLRYLSVVDGGVLRVALADIEVGGVTIRAGEGVLISTSLANRDPEVFPEPDTFDVARTNRSHIAFGYGIHQCLGQNLARVELDVAVPALFRRIPTLRLDSADLELRGSAGIQGIHRLPVTW
jgi:pentalenic acid synthase